MLFTLAFYFAKNVNRVKIDPHCANVCPFLSMLMRVNINKTNYIFSKFWKFDLFEQWRKKGAEHIGQYKKCPTDPERQKTVLGTTIIQRMKKKSNMDLMSR